MLYVDYNWDLSPELMIPDPELNTEKLEWQTGDYWQVVERNGKKMLRKVDRLEQFIIAGVEAKQQKV